MWVLFNAAVWTTVLGLSGILASFFEPRRGRTLGHCANLWGKLILFFGGVKYTIKGLENRDPDGSYIFAGNHASGFDILLAFAGLPYWGVSVSKIELKSIIILGWVMSTAGHIFVDRGRSDMALKSLEKAKLSLIKMPRSVLLFPEGTRTRDGSLGQFKQGGLLISVDTGIPIVPVAFKGTFEMLEKGSWSMKHHSVEMREGKPSSPYSYSYETRRKLANDVKTKVQELLSKA